MTTQDISRFLFQPRKHYVGAQLQQGRVLLDSDFNEDARLDDEDQRRVLLDLVGPSGSPDGGFGLDLQNGSAVIKMAVAFNGNTASPTTVLNYPIRAGSIYVCGLRFDLESHTVADFLHPGGTRSIGDWFAFQRDFLQMGPTDAPKPMTSPTPADRHTQLAFLEGWEQCVTAVEDEELLERALGGVDTSVRVRRTARVRFADVANGVTCPVAWQTIRDLLAVANGGTFAPDGCELLSGARLRVAFVDANAQDACAPCTPGSVGRFLGAQNQAIRIMLADATHYVWAFNNASPLYRVRQPNSSGDPGLIFMITPPKDVARWPLRNMVVEFLPWSALLDNGEKMSTEVGVFARITTSFDPATNTFRISAAEAAQLATLVRKWDNNHPDRAQLPNGADPDLDYLFLRVWHQVDEGDAHSLLDRDPVSGDHKLLKRLGISPVFNTTGGRAGDYWVVTVRPDTPQQVVPWNLTQANGVPPHGPRHFFAPLSLVRLRSAQFAPETSNTEIVEAVEDCTKRLRAATLLTTNCCTLTVGDGVSTTGDFTSIQDAINALPSEGGSICVLPGVYREEIVIARDDVIIEGCGIHTRLESPGGQTDKEALLQILGERVTVRTLAINVRGQVGVLVGEEDPDASLVASDVLLEELEISSDRADATHPARSCIDVRLGDAVTIRGCEMSMTGFLTDDAVVYVHGTRILVDDNRLDAFQPPSGNTFGAWGGLQIAGGSADVQVRRNRISGGFGHGITLGSLAWVPETSGPKRNFGAGAGPRDAGDGCSVMNPEPDPNTPLVRGGLKFNFETMGDIEGVIIADNHIDGMTSNGISVLTLNRLLMHNGDSDLITVNELFIERNRITNNIRNFAVLTSATRATKATAAAKAGQDEALGQLLLPANLPAAAILLADGENIAIRDNVIRDNGANDPEPVCGICIGFGNNVLIEGNRIQNNGRKLAGAGSSRFGIPGGIIVFFAGVAANMPADADPAFTSLLGSSLRVLNNVVEQNNGLALGARASGPVAIEGNFFESHGNNNTNQLPNTTYTVLVINTGLPWESVDLPSGEPNVARWNFGTPSGFATTRARLITDALTVASTDQGPFGQGGQVLFNNNHVALKFVTERNVPPGVIQGISVSLGSLDDVIMTGNQLALNVDNPTIKKKTTPTLQAPNQPPMMAHAVVVGQTANTSSNRIAEGVWDSTISLVTIGGLLASSTGNISTHKQYVANGQSVPASGNVFLPPPSNAFVVNANNIEWFQTINDAFFPFGGLFTHPIANVLINNLCKFFLELSVDPLTTPTPTPP